jgi:Fic family protein
MAQTFIWQRPGWPAFRFDMAALSNDLAAARHEQGKVVGLFQAVGLERLPDVERAIWTGEALATAAIEGESLDLDAVRSSVLRRMGEESDGRLNRHVEGLLDVMQDALAGHAKPLTADRLCRWQAALFPSGSSGLHRIAVGEFRRSENPMRIVSGPIGRERVHFEAPPSKQVAREVKQFVGWWETTRRSDPKVIDGILRAGLAHLWFETIHPFEDGNGRVGRALVDMALAQDIDNGRRLFSLSRQLMAQRTRYYEALNGAQRGTLDVTGWLAFFVEQFRLACIASEDVVGSALEKSLFWTRHARHALNERQRKVIQRLLDAGPGGFEGGMSAEKYANLARVSKATATRDLTALASLGMLAVTGQMKGTRYWVNLPGWIGNAADHPSRNA